ncbi:MAG: hypothetical protein LBK42_06385 [Propionibacteriaceae bacterium]|jgi:hypothetical protein|nr:hypothetical protein [Propionibacteriaceae bacterium]
MTEPVHYVSNPYRQAINTARLSAEASCDALSSAFGQAVAAFEGGAWKGGQADSVHEQLLDLQRDLRAVAAEAEDAFVSAHSLEPDSVPEGAWQNHWQNLGP